MGDWPSLAGGYSHSICYPNDTTHYLDVSSHASANTKGAWVEFISAMPFDGIVSVRQGNLSAYKSWLFDVGIGAAGSEQVLIANVLWDAPASTASYGENYLIPIVIPKGTRVALRCQSDTGGSTFTAAVTAIFGAGYVCYPYYNVCTTLGAATDTTRGTTIDPGGSADTYGAWVEFTPAIPFAVKGFFFVLGSKMNTARTDSHYGLDIGVGASGAECQLVTNFAFYINDVNDGIIPRISPFFPIDIPAGTRISVRAMADITESTDRLFDVILYCFG
jgi:hypothetical protein